MITEYRVFDGKVECVYTCLATLAEMEGVGYTDFGKHLIKARNEGKKEFIYRTPPKSKHGRKTLRVRIAEVEK